MSRWRIPGISTVGPTPTCAAIGTSFVVALYSARGTVRGQNSLSPASAVIGEGRSETRRSETLLRCSAVCSRWACRRTGSGTADASRSKRDRSATRGARSLARSASSPPMRSKAVHTFSGSRRRRSRLARATMIPAPRSAARWMSSKASRGSSAIAASPWWRRSRARSRSAWSWSRCARRSLTERESPERTVALPGSSMRSSPSLPPLRAAAVRMLGFLAIRFVLEP